jgi:hypothetical protein
MPKRAKSLQVQNLQVALYISNIKPVKDSSQLEIFTKNNSVHKMPLQSRNSMHADYEKDNTIPCRKMYCLKGH